MNNKILEEFNVTFDGLADTISSFTDENFNTVPFEGSWTGGQTTEHVLKSASGISKALFGTTKQTNRKPDEKVDGIKDMMLNFDSKFKSPEFIEPGEKNFDKEKHLALVKNVKEKINEAIKTKDLSELVLDFKVPGSDEFTRIEFIYFMIYHTQRHTHQLKNILNKLK